MQRLRRDTALLALRQRLLLLLPLCIWALLAVDAQRGVESIGSGNTAKGRRLIHVGASRGIAIEAGGAPVAVRLGSGSSAEDFGGAPSAFRPALAAAAVARGSQRASCPADADSSACAAWCRAVSPPRVALHGELEGGQCSLAGSKPACVCRRVGGEAELQWATCRVPCVTSTSQPSTLKDIGQTSTSGDGATVGKKQKASKQNEQAKVEQSPPSGESSNEKFRYLLYDTAFGLSFAKQLQVFAVAHKLTAALNSEISKRCKGTDTKDGACLRWKLVLPPWCSVVHWYVDSTAGMSWQEFFNVDELAGSGFVAEFTNVKKQVGTVKLMVLPAVIGADRGSKHGFAGFAADPKQCESISNGRQKEPQSRSSGGGNGRLVTYSGYCDNDLRIDDVRCARLHATGSESILEMMRAKTFLGIRTVFLKHLDAAVDFQAPWNLGLHPAPSLQNLANDFDRKTLSSFPFLAVHLRRNEFIRSHPDAAPSAAAAAARLNHLLRKLGLEQVFVATDANAVFRDELRRQVKAPLYYFFADDGAPTDLHKGKEEIVCMDLLVRAKHFIGTDRSAYSVIVRGLRAHAGHAKGSSEVFCNSLTEDSASKRCRGPEP